ncbi:Cytochrome P450 [Naviculisporaceae sp. PSN 640]
MATIISSFFEEATATSLALVVASLLFAVVVANEFRSWWKLRHIPGPFINSISNLPLTKLASTGRLSHGLKDMQKRYGPLMRIGPGTVMFGDPETHRMMSGVRSEFTKGPWYEASRMVPDQDSVFTSLDETWRKATKAKMAPGYAGKDGKAFEPKIDQCVAQLIDLIERKYISTDTEYRPLEFARTAIFFGIDAIGEISFGEAFGFLREDKDLYNYVAINEVSFPILVTVMTIPWIDKYLKSWPLNMGMPKAGDQVGFGMLMGLANQIVNQHFEPGAKPRGDMLESHIRNGMTKNELLAEIFLELIAGVDSTATAIRMIILYLLNTPAALTKLRAEIDSAVSSGLATTSSSGIISDHATYKLPYLQAVIKEGIRIVPPATGWMNKQPPKGGAEIHGYFIPEGTQIAVNIMYMMHNKEIFGVDADCFRPERWLECSEDKANEMSRVLDLCFGYGKYQCMGIKLAWTEINKVVFELVRRFDFAVVNPLQPLSIFDAAFWICKDFHLRVTKRSA